MSYAVTSTIFRLLVKLMAVVAAVHALSAGQLPIDSDRPSHRSDHRRKELRVEQDALRRSRVNDREGRLKHKNNILVPIEQFLNSRTSGKNEAALNTLGDDKHLKTTASEQNRPGYPKLKLDKNYTDQNEGNGPKRSSSSSSSSTSSSSNSNDSVERKMEEQRQHQHHHQQQNISNHSNSNVPKNLSLANEFSSSYSNETDFHDSNVLNNLQNRSDSVDTNNNTTMLQQNGTNSDNTSSKSNPFNGCASCAIRDGDRRYRIFSLQRHILGMLRMESPPNLTGKAIPKVPPVARFYQNDGNSMLNDVNMMNDSPYDKRTNHYNRFYNDPHSDDMVVKTERVFTVAKQLPEQLQLNISDSIYFSPTIQLYTSKLRTAYLWFYIRKGHVQRPHIKLTIERILPESRLDKPIVRKTVFSQKLIRDKAFGWKRIDLRETLRHWIRHPTSNYGLHLKVADDQGNNLIVLTPAATVDRGYEPWLDTKIEESRSHSRHRRSDFLVCNENSTESRCCRFPLTVPFADLGWDWIIAPSHVSAGFCSGECRTSTQHSTPHSWINQQMPITGGACCSATRLSALPLLYFDRSHNVLYQILQDMVVDRCGCV